MGRIVAARFWCCEFCDNVGFYSKDDVIGHLSSVHGIDCNSPDANMGQCGDNLIVSDLVVPESLRSIPSGPH